jgi:LacI family repressor for deo operon, udp, cdd, tsx, nupC, and nupG
VSSITIRRALRDLTQIGLIYRQNGVGTFVSSRRRTLRVILIFEGFEEDSWRIRSQLFGSLIGSIGQVLWEQGAVFSITHAASQVALLDVVNGIAEDRSFDAVLLRTVGDPLPEVVDLLSSRNLPYVVVKKRVAGRRANCVALDNRASALLATQHLLELGHRRIGCVVGPSSSSTFRDRAAGYIDALRQAGAEVDPDLLRVGCSQFDDAGHEETIRLLDLPDPPSAIVAGVDLMTRGIYQAVRERGLRIPDDISIVAFDEMGVAERYDPPLTALAPSEFDVGRRSVELLIDVVDGQVATPTEIVLAPSLIERCSTCRRNDVSLHASHSDRVFAAPAQPGPTRAGNTRHHDRHRDSR